MDIKALLYIFLSFSIFTIGCSNSVPNTPSSVEKRIFTTDEVLLNIQLIRAAKDGNIDLMRKLLEKGANINYKNTANVFPLYAFIAEGYKKNSSNTSLTFVKWLIEDKGADYKQTGYNDYSLIHISQDEKLTEYLTNLGLSINALTKSGATTLMGSLASYPANVENTSLQRYLIEHCVNLEQVAKFGTHKMTALDFTDKFNRPKAKKLLLSYLKNPPKQCQGKGILPPKISFYNTPDTFDSETINISIKIEAQGFGIGDIVILLNGTEIKPNADRALKVKRGGLRVKTFQIKVQNGLNEIRIYTYDASNTVKSKEIIKNIVAHYQLNKKPQLYAIVIGIDDFKNPSLNLRYAEADASMFGSTLFKRTRKLFSKVNIEYLRKENQTTKKAILKKLRSLKTISPNDFFVFYVATHGTTIDRKYYMITSNVNNLSSDQIKLDAISEDELRETFTEIPTANKLLLFDTCFSGGINESIAKKLSEKAVKKLNLTSITAVTSKQTALEGIADGHGVFTYILSDALDGEADINNDGLVQSMELVHYANKMVPIEAKRLHHIQTPAYFQSGQIFVVSKLRNYHGNVDLKPQYFQQKEVKALITYMDTNDVNSLNQALKIKKIQTKKLEEKIVKEAAKQEAKEAAKTIQIADKTFTFGKHKFIFNDNSIFLNITDPIKKQFSFTDTKGRHLIVFDFQSKEPAPRVIQTLDTQKVSNIYMADRGEWYRVTLQTKSKQDYEYIVTKDGIFIKIKNPQK